MATIQTDDRLGQKVATSVLVEKARSGFGEELRQSRRFPFFQPVTIYSDQEGQCPQSAFSRDISAWGIGLLLNAPVTLRPVQLKIHFGDDEEIAVSGFVRWCQPCGHGWYLAGVSFNEGNCDEIGYMVGGCIG